MLHALALTCRSRLAVCGCPHSSWRISRLTSSPGCDAPTASRPLEQALGVEVLNLFQHLGLQPQLRERSGLGVHGHIGVVAAVDHLRRGHELEQAGTDEGAAKAVVCRLLECINDKNGTMITRNRKEIVTLLLEHRREVFAPHPHYSASCVAAVNRASVEMSTFNAEMVANPPAPPGNLLGFAADSIVVLQALDPLSHVD